jgi:hypothetical protein
MLTNRANNRQQSKRNTNRPNLDNRNGRATPVHSSSNSNPVNSIRPIYQAIAPSDTQDEPPIRAPRVSHVLPNAALSHEDPTPTYTTGLWLIQVKTNEDPVIHNVQIFHPTCVKRVAVAILRTHSTCSHDISGLSDDHFTLRIVKIEVTDGGSVPEHAIAHFYPSDRTMTSMYYLGKYTLQH